MLRRVHPIEGVDVSQSRLSSIIDLCVSVNHVCMNQGVDPAEIIQCVSVSVCEQRFTVSASWRSPSLHVWNHRDSFQMQYSLVAFGGRYEPTEAEQTIRGPVFFLSPDSFESLYADRMS